MLRTDGWRLLTRDGQIATYEPLIACSARARAEHGRGEVRPPELLRHRRQDVVPDRGEAHPELRHPRRPPHEPEMEVLAAVAPAADVDAFDVPDAVDRALDADDQRPELRLALRREPLEVAVDLG